MANILASFSPLALGLYLLGCTTADEVTSPDAPTFLECLNGVSSDYQPLTPEQLVDESALIVRGRFDAVSDGRVVVSTTGLSDRYPMLVYRVHVSETLTGESHDSVYLERMKGGRCSVDASEIPLASEEVMLFLRPPGWDPDTTASEHPDRGRPPGEPLWVLPTPQALLLESGGVASPILEPGDNSFSRSSLDDVEAEVRALLETP